MAEREKWINKIGQTAENAAVAVLSVLCTLKKRDLRQRKTGKRSKNDEGKLSGEHDGERTGRKDSRTQAGNIVPGKGSRKRMENTVPEKGGRTRTENTVPGKGSRKRTENTAPEQKEQRPCHTAEAESARPLPEDLRSILELGRQIRDLDGQDMYISHSDCTGLVQACIKDLRDMEVLLGKNLLETYCRQNGISSPETMEEIKEILFLCRRGNTDRDALQTGECTEVTTDAQETYPGLAAFSAAHNDRFLQKKLETEREYLDHILDASDPAICLDEAQRRMVLTDEDNCLVIAGAGAGKTTSVAAKVKYLVDKKGIRPEEILVISFTNKAVDELRTRIQRELGIPCPICTFHAAGNAVLHIREPERVNIFDSNRKFYIIRDYLRGKVMQDERLVHSLILFFASYFDAPLNENDLEAFFRGIARMRYTSMRSELNEYSVEILDRQRKKKVTIQNEILRSQQEVEIANFLYRNGIEYEYEPVYRYHIELAKKPYTPDFVLRQGDREIYLEHFGITRDGQNTRYDAARLQAYKDAVNEKILLHRRHGTELIYTFSGYGDGRSLTEHLEEELIKHGVAFHPRSEEEILQKILQGEGNRYVRRLVELISRFISIFKVDGYTEMQFAILKEKTDNVRTQLFLDICQACYLEYQRVLREMEAVDFEDMINDSARALRECAEMKKRLGFKYIIVDEYQDISRQRFDLVKALREVCDARVIAVGDDWQSIYAFSGSDITLFTEFERRMGPSALLRIENTYRNAQELIDIAGSFVQKNPSQIVKTLHSDKRIGDPVLIYTYNAAYKRFGEGANSGAYYNMGKAIEAALDHIVEHHGIRQDPGGPNAGKQGTQDPGGSIAGKQGKQGGGNIREGKRPADMPVIKVLLIGRYNYDGYRLERTDLFTYRGKGAGRQLVSKKYPFLQITFMTAHASKGLGYDEVIVVNGQGGTYGFPSKIENDPVLSLVLREDRSYTYAEERRVFYVAMTRTKNRVYFIAPQQEPSEFLLELLRDYRSVRLDAFAGEDQKAPEPGQAGNRPDAASAGKEADAETAGREADAASMGMETDAETAGREADAASMGMETDAALAGRKAELSGENRDTALIRAEEQERKERYLHNSATGIAMERKICPICGYPLQLRYKVAYGLRLYLCTNDTEICGFMTNDLRGGSMSIMKCDRCVDGFLTVHVRRKDGSAFLGCTNYTRDGKGCGRTMGWPEYRQKMSIRRRSSIRGRFSD